MATLPAGGYLENASRTNAEMKAALEAIRDIMAENIGGEARSELTIASGGVTPPEGSGGGVFTIDTEGNAAADDLDTITQTNTRDGQIIIVMAENAARVVTIRNAQGGAGQVLLTGGANFAFASLGEWIALQRRSTDWVELQRGYGDNYYAEHDFLRIAAVPAHNMLCPHTRLRIDYATAATVTLAADAVVLADSSGRLKRFTPLSETLTLSSTGANGRDVVDNSGNEQASSWYHLFAIGNTDGTLDVFASQVGFPGSGTSIYTRLPSGYTWAGYLGAAYNDGSSNLADFKQRGNLVGSWAGSSVVNAGTAATYTAVALTGSVPITAAAIDLDIRAVATGAVTSVTAVAAAEGSGTSAQYGFVVAASGGASSANMIGRTYGRLMLTTAQQFKYFVSASASCTINLTGWVY